MQYLYNLYSWAGLVTIFFTNPGWPPLPGPCCELVRCGTRGSGAEGAAVAAGDGTGAGAGGAGRPPMSGRCGFWWVESWRIQEQPSSKKIIVGSYHELPNHNLANLKSPQPPRVIHVRGYFVSTFLSRSKQELAGQKRPIWDHQIQPQFNKLYQSP